MSKQNNNNQNIDEKFKFANDCENEETDLFFDNEQSHSNMDDVSADTLYYIELAQRLKADFDNYKKRNEQLARSSKAVGVIQTIEKFLPVIDSINIATTKMTDTQVLEGLNLIKTQFLNSLKDLGVSPIESVGKVFDPQIHNAVLTGSEDDKLDDEVLEEYQQGFIMQDGKVIRYSTVKINKK